MDFNFESPILIVDDMIQIRTLLKAGLNSLGYTNIQEAVNGSDALEIIEKSNNNSNLFKIVFLDINMPVMTGLQALSELQGREYFKDLKVIMVSTENEQNMIIEAVVHGAADYLLKPFSSELLEEKINKLRA